MKSKNIWIIVALIILIIIGVVAWQGAVNKTGKAPTINDAGQTEEGAAAGDIGAMTDDIFVEIAAHSTYYAQTDMENWLSLMESLYNQYGVTEENFNAYAVFLDSNPDLSVKVAEKYTKRLTELLGPIGE
ncbi:MAG: hypothetical protein PHO28_03170 [Candidatus Pacebacteria bacterium]|nr:hypothetical protein [Candidatus Paceibacterota bacterium]